MKMKFSIMFAVLVLAVFSVSSSFGATCDTMSIEGVAANDGSTAAQVWLKNDTAAACGLIPAGGKGLFNLPSTNQDKMLATILTAFSLTKTLWAAYDDTGMTAVGGDANTLATGMLQIASMSAN